MTLYPSDLKKPVVDELISVVQKKNMTVREAAEAFDAAKARLADVTVQTFSRVAPDEVENARIPALKELRLV